MLQSQADGNKNVHLDTCIVYLYIPIYSVHTAWQQYLNIVYMNKPLVCNKCCGGFLIKCVYETYAEYISQHFVSTGIECIGCNDQVHMV